MRSRPTYWDLVRKEIRPKFAKAGLLNTCELNWPKCIGTRLNLTFAHSLRRRKIDKFKKDNPEMYEKKMREVIRACVKCHEMLDSLESHEETERIVKEVIKNRIKPVI